MASANAVKLEYHNWLIDKVSETDTWRNTNFKMLFRYLGERIFHIELPADIQRVNDAIALRVRFCQTYACAHNVSEDWVFDMVSITGTQLCSVLELMVALCERIEAEIMTDPAQGDRTRFWFWNMIASLGVSDCNDSHFDNRKVSKTLDIFIRRIYADDGTGGLVTIPGYSGMRSMPIWDQCMQWLNRVISGQL